MRCRCRIHILKKNGTCTGTGTELSLVHAASRVRLVNTATQKAELRGARKMQARLIGGIRPYAPYHARHTRPVDFRGGQYTGCAPIPNVGHQSNLRGHTRGRMIEGAYIIVGGLQSQA
eukprot:COSAG02_NODE_36931_length_448_cov_2.770774_1_plen_117_part_10